MTGTAQLKFIKYFEIAKIAYHNNVTYFGDVLGIGGLVAFRIWYFTQLYETAFRLSGLSSLGDLTLAQTIWILAFTQSFHVSNRTRATMKNIEYEVKSGSIAYTINKPYSYVLYNYYTCLGVAGSNILTTVLFGCAAALLLVGGIKFTVMGLLAGAVLLFFGVTLNSLAILIIGLSAFWTEDTSAFRWIYDKILWIFGGLFLPFSILPNKYQTLIEWLPFKQMFYGPARMIVKFDGNLFYKDLLIQLIWVVVLSGIVTWMYRKGSKNLSVNAG
jgi:ABC-2 type transport system permease protein